jgi:hypothetical protein
MKKKMKEYRKLYSIAVDCEKAGRRAAQESSITHESARLDSFKNVNRP